MTREKIISLASDAGFDIDEANEYHAEDQVKDSGNNWITPRLEAFYHAAQAEAFEAAASRCDEQYPYSVHHTDQLAAKNCAAAIREMAKELK